MNGERASFTELTHDWEIFLYESGNIFLGYLHFQVVFLIHIFGIYYCEYFPFSKWKSVISSSRELWGVLLLYIYRKSECLADHLTIKLNCENCIWASSRLIIYIFCEITCQAYRVNIFTWVKVNDVCHTFLLHKARNPRIFWLNFLQLWD